jgi:hypothetical protein
MSEIEVTKRFKETKDANLRSLQTYVELADEMGLIEGNLPLFVCVSKHYRHGYVK